MSTLNKNRPVVPDVWRHVDAQPEPGSTSGPAARHHWHCLKILRALSHFGALGDVGSLRALSKPTRLGDFMPGARRRDARWAEVARHATAASHSGPIGPEHNAVLMLAVQVREPLLSTGYEGRCAVPPESDLLAMAEACMRERGTHWDVLDESGRPPEQIDFRERRRNFLKAGWQHEALSPETAVELDVLLDYAGIKKNGKLNEQVLDPLQGLGLLHRLTTNPPLWWTARAFGQPD